MYIFIYKINHIICFFTKWLDRMWVSYIYITKYYRPGTELKIIFEGQIFLLKNLKRIYIPSLLQVLKHNIINLYGWTLKLYAIYEYDRQDLLICGGSSTFYNQILFKKFKEYKLLGRFWGDHSHPMPSWIRPFYRSLVKLDMCKWSSILYKSFFCWRIEEWSIRDSNFIYHFFESNFIYDKHPT